MPGIALPSLLKGIPTSLLGDGAENGPWFVASDTGGRILTVGVGKQYSTLSAAIAASGNGDVIKVDAGTYINDTASVNTNITIEGVGGMVNLMQTRALGNQKGILIINANVTIANVSFSGATIADSLGANGAGIRYQGGNLTLINDVFTGNQNGLMGTPVDGLPSNTITIDHCTFRGNGVSDPTSVGYGYTHNLYVGTVSNLSITNSVFQEVAGVGHEIKSRAYVTNIVNNVIADGNASASYSIDLPDGGAATITGNYIEKGANVQNYSTIHFGGESFPYSRSSLMIQGNTIVNDLGGAARLLLNQTMIAATITGNTLNNFTAQQIASGPVRATSNVDGNGNALANSNSSQLLPSNFTVFTDSLAHSVTLAASNSGVMGGAGLLAVDDPAGHVIVIGGTGGLVFAERFGAGGSTITTAAGSVNRLTISGQDSIDSEGTDVINVGTGNAKVLVNGSAAVSSGPGSNAYTVNGTMTLVGGGGSDFISLSYAARAYVSGTESYIEFNSVGGGFGLNAIVAGSLAQATVQGGSMQVRSYDGALNFNTAGGLGQGAIITLGAGAMNVQSHAADTIYAGSGTDMLQLSGGGQTIFAGTGNLSIYGMSIQAGSNAIVYGNGGNTRIDGDTGNITYFGGALNSTVQAILSNIVLVGGAGHLTINGGARDTITGGAGGITLNGGAADTITTAAGSGNTLMLSGSCTVNSWGNDTINAGSGNQQMVLHGNASVTGARGSNVITMLGTDSLTATAGNEQVTVGSGAHVKISTAAWTTLTETNATVDYTAITGTERIPVSTSVTVTGGSASIFSAADHMLSVQTTASTSTKVVLGTGTVSVQALGADTIFAGVGRGIVTASANGALITGGAGTLSVTGLDRNAGDNITVLGGAGKVTMGNGGFGKMTFIGGSGDAVIDGGYGALYVRAGAGNTAVTGGSGMLRFTAGSGTAAVAISQAGGSVKFGAGNTTVSNLVNYGAADTFTCAAGSGGGIDIIQGFRLGTDKLVLQGVGITSQRVIGGSTWLTLTDRTQVGLVGVTKFNM